MSHQETNKAAGAVQNLCKNHTGALVGTDPAGICPASLHIPGCCRHKGVAATLWGHITPWGGLWGCISADPPPQHHWHQVPVLPFPPNTAQLCSSCARGCSGGLADGRPTRPSPLSKPTQLSHPTTGTAVDTGPAHCVPPQCCCPTAPQPLTSPPGSALLHSHPSSPLALLSTCPVLYACLVLAVTLIGSLKQ